MQKTVNYNNTDHILETQKKTKAYKNAKQWMALLHWAFQKKSQLIYKHEEEWSGNYYYCDNENSIVIRTIYIPTSIHVNYHEKQDWQNSSATRLTSQVTWIKETKLARQEVKGRLFHHCPFKSIKKPPKPNASRSFWIKPWQIHKKTQGRKMSLLEATLIFEKLLTNTCFVQK